jgi:hypothetical protein
MRAIGGYKQAGGVFYIASRTVERCPKASGQLKGMRDSTVAFSVTPLAE